MKLSALIAVIFLCLAFAPERAVAQPADELSSELREVADLFVKKGQLDKAISIYDEIRQSKPDDEEILFALIDACMQSKRCAPRREGLLREARKLAPAHGEALEQLYSLLVEEGRVVEAVAELESFLTLMPQARQALALLAYAHDELYGGLVELGEPARALAELKKFVGRHPEHQEARSLLADVLIERGHLAGAERELRAIVSRDAGHQLARESLIDVLERRGDRKGALREVRQFVKRQRDHLPMRLIMLDLLEGLGRFKEYDRELTLLLREQGRDALVWITVGERALARDKLGAAHAAARQARALPLGRELAGRLKVLETTIARAYAERYAEFRRETRWSDLEDDIEQSFYP